MEKLSMSDSTTTTPQLQINDLLLTAQFIQIASQRGAIKPEEFTQIGGLYDRLVAFLQASGAITPAQAPAQQPQDPTSVVTD
jgi:hypothetical protein